MRIDQQLFPFFVPCRHRIAAGDSNLCEETILFCLEMSRNALGSPCIAGLLVAILDLDVCVFVAAYELWAMLHLPYLGR